jgi:hypothetical protein
MQSNNYHSAKAGNGRLGGLAKAKNNAARVEKARLENHGKSATFSAQAACHEAS